MGYGLSREGVMRMAYVRVERTGKQHPFKHEFAGRGWFCEWHRNLAVRTPQPLSYCRAV